MRDWDSVYIGISVSFFFSTNLQFISIHTLYNYKIQQLQYNFRHIITNTAHYKNFFTENPLQPIQNEYILLFLRAL